MSPAEKRYSTRTTTASPRASIAESFMEHNGNSSDGDAGRLPTERRQFRETVAEIVRTTQVVDIHTHLFAPEFGGLNLYGIDHLLTYHYLVAEMFRAVRITPEAYWSLDRTEQADLVWKTLFVDNTPVSEAARGVVTVLTSLGIDPSVGSLREAREYFSSRDLAEHVDNVFKMAGVASVVMTNDLFDGEELAFWEKDNSFDTRFETSLRLDRVLNSWPYAVQFLTGSDYRVDSHLSGPSIVEIRRYIDNWILRMKPLYMAVSLPDDFRYPAADIRSRLINEVVLPIAREHDLPVALMIGVRRQVNPALRAAGDGVGRADVSSLERLCVENPDARFLATFLSRENQHELCVAARKFSNLMPFGCWWFLNNPSIVAEITTERLELLGTSFIPQHSDARVLEQLIYKWKHSRGVIADCLSASYEQLADAGRPLNVSDVQRDVRKMFSGNFESWIGSRIPAVERA